MHPSVGGTDSETLLGMVHMFPAQAAAYDTISEQRTSDSKWKRCITASTLQACWQLPQSLQRYLGNIHRHVIPSCIKQWCVLILVTSTTSTSFQESLGCHWHSAPQHFWPHHISIAAGGGSSRLLYHLANRNLPSRPAPSFTTQLMAAAVSPECLPATPKAPRRDLVVKTEIAPPKKYWHPRHAM